MLSCFTHISEVIILQACPRKCQGTPSQCQISSSCQENWTGPADAENSKKTVAIPAQKKERIVIYIIYIFIYKCTYIYIYTYVCVCVCVCVMYVYIYTTSFNGNLFFGAYKPTKRVNICNYEQPEGNEQFGRHSHSFTLLSEHLNVISVNSHIEHGHL